MLRSLIRLMFGLTLAAFVLTGCGGATSETSAPAADVAAPAAEQPANGAALAANLDPATVADLQAEGSVLVIDVREQWEYDEGHIPGVLHIPMQEVPQRLAELPTDQSIVVSCRSGNRSSQVADYLRTQGYERIHNLDGGILAWERAGLPVER